MTLKRVIDADKICANLLFLRNLRSHFRRYRCQPVVSPVQSKSGAQILAYSSAHIRSIRVIRVP